MLINVKGDILLTRAQAIAQGVGVNDPMDKGLALQLRRNFPTLHKDFDRWCYQHDTHPGEAWLWKGPDKQRIINLITHENTLVRESHYYKATLRHIKQALASLVTIIDHEALASIALPKLGTGLGDLDWDDVRPLIEEQLGDLPVTAFIYAEYCPGQKGLELIAQEKA